MPDGPTPSSRFTRTNPVVALVALVAAAAAVSGVVLVANGSGSIQTTVSSAQRMDAGHMTPSARRGELNVAVGDYWFTPSTQRLRAGVYRFVARNYGVVGHDVMVERMPIRFSAPGAPVDEAAPFGVDGLKPGMTKTTKVRLSAGRWEIFCSVAGHYQAGQHQIITVYGQTPREMRTRKSTGMGKQTPGGMGMPSS